MGRIGLFCVMMLGLLAGCESGPTRDKTGIYRLDERDRPTVEYRMLDSVNFLRQSAGAAPLQLDARLSSAAQVHAQDMSRQQRPWPFGSDGSNPYERVARSGFAGELVSEVYAQSYESEMQTLTAWVEDQAWGPSILDPEATHMGFAWQQDPSGLIWWVLVLGKAGGLNGGSDGGFGFDDPAF